VFLLEHDRILTQWNHNKFVAGFWCQGFADLPWYDHLILEERVTSPMPYI